MQSISVRRAGTARSTRSTPFGKCESSTTAWSAQRRIRPSLLNLRLIQRRPFARRASSFSFDLCVARSLGAHTRNERNISRRMALPESARLSMSSDGNFALMLSSSFRLRPGGTADRSTISAMWLRTWERCCTSAELCMTTPPKRCRLPGKRCRFSAIHHAGWDRESSDYVFSEAGMIL